MYIAQITYIRLHPDADAEIPARAFKEVEQWLEQWTPKANFKAVAASTEAGCMDILIQDLQANLVPHHMRGVKPQHFQFEVSMQHAPDNRFWMPSGIRSGPWHDIP